MVDPPADLSDAGSSPNHPPASPGGSKLVSLAMLVVQLTPGAHGKVTQLLRERPLIALTGSPLNRHLAFCSQEELVLLFEGSGAERAARVLAEGNETALSPYIAAPPRRLEEVFSWYWPQAPSGVSYHPWPGPGNSDGGATQ